MISYTLEKRPGMSLTESLCAHLRADISSGVLAAGQKLPSKRQFARDLGVSVITVERAYDQLQAEGYVASQPKRGFYVCEIPRPPVVGVAFAADSAVMAPAVGEASCAGSRTDVGSLRGRVRIDLVSPDMPQGLFPAKVWNRMVRDALLDPADWQGRPADSQGIVELREAIARHVAGSRGVECSPDQVVVGAGSQQLYQMCSLLFEPGCKIGVEDPGYPRLRETYQALGFEVESVALDDLGMSAQLLEESGALVAHVTPSHHFPTGLVMPAGRRGELLTWAAAGPDAKGQSAAAGHSAAGGQSTAATQEAPHPPRRLIVEDDYDCEFRLAGRPIPALQSIDPHGTVIYMNTFSKSLVPWLRVAYMILPWDLLERYRQRAGFMSSAVSALDQVVLARFINEGHFDRHVGRLRKRYRDIRDALLERLTDAAPGLRIAGQDAGLFFLIDLASASAAEVKTRLLERGVRATCLSDYRAKRAQAEGAGVDAAAGFADATAGSADATAGCPQDGCASVRFDALMVNYTGLGLEDVPEVVDAILFALGRAQDAR